MAIARRVCLDRLRSKKGVCLVSLDERDAVSANNVENKIDIQRALNKLNYDDRILLYLRIGQELSFMEVAQVLGRTDAACRKRFERAKKRFETAYRGGEE